MPDVRAHWIVGLARRMNIAAAVGGFLAAETIFILIVAKPSKLPLERIPLTLFLLPMAGLFPMVVGVQAYRRVKRRLLKDGVDPQSLDLIRSLVVSVIAVCYATILITAAALLSGMPVSARG